MATRRIYLTVPGVFAALAASPASAQLEEIVVTAQRREQSLQDVPISVTAVTGDAIRRGGFSDMEDLSAFVPNLFMRDTFTGQVLAIRGIGTTAGNEAFESAVAIFHDDIYYGRDNLGQNSFFDLERVEVLRGPQPLFFGQSATAGAMNVTSRAPGDSLEGNAQIAYGDDEELNFEFGIGGPVSDNFGLRFSTRYYELGDNVYFNPLTGRKLAVKENTSSRLLGIWEPSERVRVRLKYEYQDVWQEGTGGEFARCDLDPQMSTSNAAITAGFNALCTLDHLAGVINVNEFDGASGNQGVVDIYDRVAALNAASGAVFGDPDYVADGSYRIVPYLTSGMLVPLGPVANPGSGPGQPGCCDSGYIRPNLDEVYEMGQPEERYFDSNVYSARIDWDISDTLTLTSTSGYLDYDKLDWLDPDASTLAIFTDLRLETFEQTSQEIRLQSDADRTFSWMAGVYWQESDLDSTLNVYLGSLLGAMPSLRANPDPNVAAASYGVQLLQTSEWQSLFLAGTFNVSDAFRINVGGRYQDTTKTGNQIGTDAYLTQTGTNFGPRAEFQNIDQRIEFDDFLPEVGVQWDTTEDLMLYAKYSEAFKMGGFVVAPPIGGSVDQSIYQPEEAEGIELGFKSTLLDGQLEFNLAYYDTDYTNLQVSVFIVDSAHPQGFFNTTNAAAANSAGFEWDGRWAVTDNFILGFNGSLAEGEFTDYSGAECNSLDDKLWDLDPNTSGDCRQDLSGVALGNFPEWTLGLQPQYAFDLGNSFRGTLSGNVFFSDGYEMSATPQADPLSIIGSWHRVDLNFTVAPMDGNWEIGVYARDLTDEKVWIGAGQNNFQSRTIRLDYDPGTVTTERGRRVGVQFNYLFGN
jgi:outer membrane receptor protein involved in Fe transport